MQRASGQALASCPLPLPSYPLAMSSSIAIRVENLGKRYRIGHLQKKHDTLRDLIASMFRRGNQRSPVAEDTIWALKDVSFEVSQGEVIGVIGRNGAGKSTLLKILSRITDPTEGFAEIHGRCSSLLEVGTGFHPELTGRENIYLNGSILGMKRAEIARKFDEIVAFAEVEKFIDTPVKHYSSGMYVRLAFAVAAHLEPEIMVVDEVLAVGDIEFQRKCLGKMGEVAKSGRTVVLVSHNMAAIRSLCQTAIWMEKGETKLIGLAPEIVRAYEQACLTSCGSSGIAERHLEGGVRTGFHLNRVEMFNDQGNRAATFAYNETLILSVHITGCPEGKSYNLEFRVFNELDQLVCVGSSAFHGMLLDKNTKRVNISVGPLTLTSGHYAISFSAVDSLTPTRYDTWENCCSFDVTECTPFGFGHEMPTCREGVCILQQSFSESK